MYWDSPLLPKTYSFNVTASWFSALGLGFRKLDWMIVFTTDCFCLTVLPLLSYRGPALIGFGAYRYACIRLSDICTHTPHVRSPMNGDNRKQDSKVLWLYVISSAHLSTEAMQQHAYLHVPMRFSEFSARSFTGTTKLPIPVFFSGLFEFDCMANESPSHLP